MNNIDTSILFGKKGLDADSLFNQKWHNFLIVFMASIFVIIMTIAFVFLNFI